MSAADKSDKQKVEAFVKALTLKGIQVLAVDFDQTLLSIHSGGQWRDGVESLAQHVRPCMRDLLQHAIQRGLFVCIVTFFKQAWLIRELLQHVFPKRIASKILVQANTIDLLQRQGPDEFVGKEAHLINIFNELYQRHHVVVSSKEVMLLDDDEENVRTAIQFGHYSFLIPTDLNYENFESFAKMLTVT
ncbi:uncharacterized protein [Haliotis asinina]|uniref:uncharacterized protein n=1 Tax=Haliotis asinina TaxID=109174 RepID=UPI00353251DF